MIGVGAEEAWLSTERYSEMKEMISVAQWASLHVSMLPPTFQVPT
jgi:hypothetical protein